MKIPTPQFAKFVLVGLSNTCLSFGIYSAMMHELPARPAMAALSQAVSYSGGMILSYLLNNFWVFRDKRQPAQALPGFIVSQLGLLVLSASAMAVATHYVHVRAELIWLSVMAIITVLNFTVLKKWVFKTA